MTQLWSTLNASLRFDALGGLLLAVVLGGVVGLERELHGKAAVLRTSILVCVGAAPFTQLSVYMAGDAGDPSRIAAQIVTGVGFLGAGTILHNRGEVGKISTIACEARLRALDIHAVEREGRRVVMGAAEGELVLHHATPSRYLGIASDVTVRVDE